MILEGEIKDTKMCSSLSDFQTVIKHLSPAAYSDENVHLHFPKGAECRQKMIAKYLSRHLLQRCRVWAEISASSSYLLMHDMGGNFRLHFFTIARCG